jgi:glycosyltransferase involved in cell wall biosynthesis
MSRTINILHISPDFNYSCGVSKYVYSLLKEFGENESYKLFFLTNGGDAIDRLEGINVVSDFMNLSKGFVNVLNIYPNLRTLKEFCIQNRIDIVHTHHRYPEYLAYQISKKTKIKTITTAHSLVKGKTRFSFKSGKIIAVSDSVKNMLINYYKVPSEKITMLRNYIEQPCHKEQEPDFNVRASLDIPADARVILFLGRICKIKGVDLLIKAFKLLRQKDKGIFLLIIGQVYDNSLNSAFKNLPDGIKQLGVVKNPYPYYSAADLVVLPSRTDPFPYVMLEAGIMHKPFLGSRTGGIEEFIKDGINGVLFESENVTELKVKIEYIINNKMKAQVMAENLYKKVKEQISKDKYIAQMAKIYDELLKVKWY